MSDEDAKIDQEIEEEISQGSIQAIRDRLAKVEAEARDLAAKNLALETAMAETAAQSHLMTGDSAKSGLRMDVARHVTIPTRPVIENPDDYKNVINLQDVSQRSGN